mgnify:CR=1 FL=1
MVGLNHHPELDRLTRALKNGRITPLDETTRNNAISMTQGPAKLQKVFATAAKEPVSELKAPVSRKPFEINYSPKRLEMLAMMKD